VSDQSVDTKRRPLSLGKLCLLLAAGIGSFLVAFLSQGGSREIEDDLLVVRPGARSSVATLSEVEVTRADPSPLTSSTPSEETKSSIRMNRMVVRDPFGLLSPDQPPPTVVAIAPPSAVTGSKSGPKKNTGQALPPAPPPAPPAAPALPFTAVGFIQGKKIADGQQQTFIQQGETLTMIRRGDTINSTYRVEDITEERVLLTYLPLGQKQTLPLTDNPR
jgi:hypothetical protein